jgi:hypothetical protein
VITTNLSPMMKNSATGHKAYWRIAFVHSLLGMDFFQKKLFPDISWRSVGN